MRGRVLEGIRTAVLGLRPSRFLMGKFRAAQGNVGLDNTVLKRFYSPQLEAKRPLARPAHPDLAVAAPKEVKRHSAPPPVRRAHPPLSMTTLQTRPPHASLSMAAPKIEAFNPPRRQLHTSPADKKNPAAPVNPASAHQQFLNLHSLLKSSKAMAEMYRGAERDAHDARHGDKLAQDIAEYEAAIQKLIDAESLQHQKNYQSQITEDNEEEFLKILFDLIAKQSQHKKDSTAYFDLEAEISGLRRAINPRCQRVIVHNRSWIATKAVKKLRDLGFDVYISYEEADKNTRAVRSVPEDHRLLVASYKDPKGLQAHALALKQRYPQDKIGVYFGIGFLSENVEATKWCEDNGIHPFSPGSKAMAIYSNKAKSNQAAAALGVPVPKSAAVDARDVAALLKAAEEIGYPLMTKKDTDTGRGLGNKIVTTPEELLQVARRSVKEGYTFMLQQLIPREHARHIEYQFLTDKSGCLLVDIRECSLQDDIGGKKAESSLSARIPRQRMDHAAAEIMRDAYALGYIGPGTIEFLLDEETGEYYFIEMNTRLQVEHPVTDMVINGDLMTMGMRASAEKSTEKWLQKRFPAYQHLSAQQIIDHLHQDAGHVRNFRVQAEGIVYQDGRLYPRGFQGEVMSIEVPASTEDLVVVVDAEPGTTFNPTRREAVESQVGHVTSRSKISMRDAEEKGLAALQAIRANVGGRIDTSHAEYITSLFHWKNKQQKGRDTLSTVPTFNRLYAVRHGTNLAFFNKHKTAHQPPEPISIDTIHAWEKEWAKENANTPKDKQISWEAFRDMKLAEMMMKSTVSQRRS